MSAPLAPGPVPTVSGAPAAAPSIGADGQPRLRFGPVTVVLGEKSGKYPDGNQVLVQGADSRVAFDTPQVANRIGPELDAVDLVILGHVHEDHMAGLARLRHVPVQVHEADLAAARSWPGLAAHFGLPEPAASALKAKIEVDFAYTPRPDATGYADGQTWDLGGGVRVSAHHFPGHTSGHCVLLVEPVGLAFIGDIDLSGFGPYYGDATSSLADFRRTLKRLPELPARLWVTSHHRAVVTERAAFLQALTAFAGKIDDREARLLQMLSPGPRSLDDLVRERLLYPPEHEALWVEAAERRSIGQHLDELIARGEVRCLDDQRYERC